MSSNKNINLLQGTSSKASATSYLKTYLIHSSEVIPPFGDRHSDFNPRVLSHSSNSLYVAADQDRSHRSQKRLSTLMSLLIQDSVTTLQLIKHLRIMMDNFPAYQSQLSSFDPNGYEDRQTQIRQLKICIYSHSFHRHCQI